MEKVSKDTNTVMELTVDKNATERVITAEISIEVTGEDEPTIYDKRRARWMIVALFFLVATFLSILFFTLVDMSEYACWSIIINTLAFCVSFSKAIARSSKEPTGYAPWYYGAL